jgi:hypothetical protein
MIGIGAGVAVFILLQFAGPEEFIRSRRRRAGKLDEADDEDEGAEQEQDEGLTRTPPARAPQPRTPMPAWPASIPAPPAYAPWSTASGPQPGQPYRR